MKENISIIDELDFTLGTVSVQASEDLSALKNHYVRQIEDFGVDVIYFSGEFPSVYFKKINDFNSEENRQEILAIHKKIWNQGKVPFLYVESATEVRVYNCYEQPVHEEQQDRSINNIKLYQTALNDLGELKEVFDKVSIETGRFWQHKKFANQVKNEARVEQELIKNLKKTRNRLKEEGLPVPVIHNLLLRSLFILYLEDKEATDADFYQRITGLKCTSYFDILEDRTAAYRLFAELEDKFNGNLSPVTEEENLLVTEAHLEKIKDCFWAEIKKKDGQLSLFKDWRLFNFEIIPIQLISEIYEEFLGEEDPKGKAKAGAFYTPHPLAEFVLNEVLPYPSPQDTRYKIKTLDPTCGSGIFLVETLNRLLDRWEMANPGKQLNFGTICKIVKENIFGIEINPEAIKVAAFSIYLAMLNRLNPKTLWQNKRFPYLINDPEQKDEKKQGYNLFYTSSLKNGIFEENKYDLIVGNPPFGTKNLSKDVKSYVESRGYATEAVLAFLHRATVLSPTAKIALLTTTKILLNNKSTYQNFRKFLFHETYVDKIINLSILRKVSLQQGRKYLPKASVPISIIFYSATLPKKIPLKLEYWAPKTAIKNSLIDGIAIDPTDIKFLPREECIKTDTKIWKAAMWGSEKDFSIIKKFFKNSSISDFLERENWEKGRGFQVSKPTSDEIIEIKKLPHIPAENLTRYYTDKKNTVTVNFTKFERTGKINAYQSPHLLIKEGLKNKRFCASYLDYACSFRDTIYGIHTRDSKGLMLLLAFLNSRLATYIMFLIASDWGIERVRVKPNEMLQLPNLSFSIEKKAQNLVINIINEIIKAKKNNTLNVTSIIVKLEKELEKTLWEALNLSKFEMVLINDFLDYTLDAFQNKQKSIANNPTNINDRQLYAEYLCKTMNQYSGYDKELVVWASVFELSPRIPLNVTILYFNQDKQADEITTLPENQIGQILKQMEKHSYDAHAESIYYRRFFRYYADDRLYIIKPNEKRFWSRSMAINDAGEITAEILNSK